MRNFYAQLACDAVEEAGRRCVCGQILHNDDARIFEVACSLRVKNTR